MEIQFILLFSLIAVCPKHSSPNVELHRSKASQPVLAIKPSCEEIQLKNNFSSYYFKNLTTNYG